MPRSKYQEDAIIKVLKYLRDQPGRGTTTHNMINHFEKNQAAIDYIHMLWPEKETDYIVKSYQDDCREYVLSEKGLFKLFDYEQLKLTRRISVLAIIIAVVSVIATIATSLWQILS